MKTFHHGGRIGDCIFSLYTMAKLGGGKLYLTDFHEGNWDQRIAEQLLPLIQYQEYVDQAQFVPYDHFTNEVDYDLHAAELDYNPEQFPEWNHKVWPGNISIAKRYAIHFGIDFIPGFPWLTAPKTFENIDVVFHAPIRRVVDKDQLVAIMVGLASAGKKIAIIGGESDWTEWREMIISHEITAIWPPTLLDAADMINSAKVFLGAVSSGNAIAEGLDKPNFVQVTDGCDNTFPYQVINGMDPLRVVRQIEELL